MRNKQFSQNKQGLTLAAHILQLVGSIAIIAISYRKQIPNACFVAKSVNVNNFFLIYIYVFNYQHFFYVIFLGIIITCKFAVAITCESLVVCSWQLVWFSMLAIKLTFVNSGGSLGNLLLNKINACQIFKNIASIKPNQM